jgi:hypothetical protein
MSANQIRPPSVVDCMSFPTRPSSYFLFGFFSQHLFGPVAYFIPSGELRKHALDDTSVPYHLVDLGFGRIGEGGKRKGGKGG